MKRIVSVFLLAVMVFSATLVPARANNMEASQVEQLFDELTETLALEMLENESGGSNSYSDEIKRINEELYALGVQSLSEEEVESRFTGNQSKNARIAKPANTNTVLWYLYNYKYEVYESEQYDVQMLVAVGNNPGGMLVTGEDNYRFFSGKEKSLKGVQNILSIIIQKAIGYVPGIKWTPYELLFSDLPSNMINSHYVTHRCVSTISFAYVKKSSQSDYFYELSHRSNKLSLAVMTHGAAVVNTEAKTYADSKTMTIATENFNSTRAAIKAYLNQSYKYDYFPYYVIESFDGEQTKYVYVANPSGPGEVY